MQFQLPSAKLLPPRLVIQNCEVWTATDVRKNQDVVIINGIIDQIKPTGSSHPGFEVLAPQEGLLMPLGVDVQAHLRVPGQAHKETAATGVYAGLKGGYGSLLTMPNTNPVIDNVEICNLAKEELNPVCEKLGLSVYLSAAMTLGQNGTQAVDALPLARWGVKAFTDDGKGLASTELMIELFKISERTGLPLLQHAEMPGHGGVLAPGPVQKKLGVKAYDPTPEVEMVRRDIELLRQFPKARYHVLHVSARETIELVAQAKAEGLPITCEVCPHHLLFNSNDIKADDSSFKMNPPLRSPLDQEVLQKGLESGVIDFMSTDHAPHEPQMKTLDFVAAAFGTTGLETALLSLLYLHQKGKLSPQRVVETFSTKAAEFLKIENEIGSLKVGEKFRGVLVSEKQKTREIEFADLASLSKNNVFIGFSLPGKITHVFNDKGIFEFTS